MNTWTHSDVGVAPEEGVRLLPVASLVAGDSPRLKGVDPEHVHMLAESTEPWPPILVHARTLRVIDGVHRLLAARSLDYDTIPATLFDGNDDAAFVECIRINTRHGLPLTLRDRTAAAARVVRSHPEWSDRRIAALVCLSPKTVGGIRSRLTEEIPQSGVRIGRDGQPRRLPTRSGRRRCGTERIGETGDTEADVDGADALVPQPRSPEPRGPHAAPDRSRRWERSGSGARRPLRAAGPDPADRLATYEVLRRDPSFRLTEAGRSLLRLLGMQLAHVGDWNQLVAHVPVHQAASVADLARECARAWLDLADQVCAGADGVDTAVAEGR